MDNNLIIESIQDESFNSQTGIKKLFLRIHSNSNDIDVLINILQIVEVIKDGNGTLIKMTNGTIYHSCTGYDQIKTYLNEALDLQWLIEARMISEP